MNKRSNAFLLSVVNSQTIRLRLTDKLDSYSFEEVSQFMNELLWDKHELFYST